MSDEEEDYMSEKFLATLEDVRPSLIQDRGKKRLINVEYRKQESTKRQRESSGFNRNERLQESLKQALTEDNKGFQMLAKMGYKPGQALGKAPSTSEESQTAAKRLTVPIAISIKDDRGGLGREAALQELNEKRRELRQQRLLKKLGGTEPLTTDEFRRRATAKAQERFTSAALCGCQKVCENLDTEAKVEEPEMPWFWPERITETTSDEATEKEEESTTENDMEKEEEFSNTEKLEMLTSYVRTAYTFCFWCGVKYENEEDLNTNCPGLTRDEH